MIDLDLADRAGTKQPSIARLEAGKVIPRLDLLEKIAASLGLALDAWLPTRAGGCQNLSSATARSTKHMRFLLAKELPRLRLYHVQPIQEQLLAGRRLLHPMRDQMAEHLADSGNGRLVGLTSRGWFHIRWLHLNRPQLVELRQLLRSQDLLGQTIEDALAERKKLQARIEILEAQITRLGRLVEDLAKPK